MRSYNSQYLNEREREREREREGGRLLLVQHKDLWVTLTEAAWSEHFTTKWRTVCPSPLIRLSFCLIIKHFSVFFSFCALGWEEPADDDKRVAVAGKDSSGPAVVRGEHSDQPEEAEGYLLVLHGDSLPLYELILLT